VARRRSAGLTVGAGNNTPDWHHPARYCLLVSESPPTPLARKLGIVDGSTVAVFGAPSDLDLDLPPGVEVRHQARGTADVVVAFFTEATVLEGRISRLAPMVFPAGGLWVAWPKRSSGVVTDVTDHHVRGVGLPMGLVDNKVCAIDDTWTGLRLVWRRSLREGDRPGGRGPPR
jgi:hypothetical protein